MNKIKISCIIDDDPIFVYGTKRMMKQIDFCEDIMVYVNGQEALDGLTNLKKKGGNLPSVIFLDLNMPIMNGWEFLDDFLQILDNGQDKVTIYIISSSVDPLELDQVKNYSIVRNYILKPLTPQDLKNVLKEVA
ncbi:response regulator [Spongiimicrobium sp. 3-5]|uniref:response regulator n=1 Tax=Spongiimicrobium sp. 3-5 TaxID=3332596 RepID=UPI0039818097